MSELRRHFEAGKAEHDAARYPGSLARDVFAAPVIEYGRPDAGRHASLFKILASAGGLAAAAALIALVIWLHQPINGVQKIYVSIAPSPAEDPTPFVIHTVPDMPTNLQIAPHDLGNLAPDYQSISVSSVPSFWDLNSDSSNNNSSSSSSSKEPA